MAIPSWIKNITDLWNAYKRGEIMSDEVRTFLSSKFGYPPAEQRRIIDTWNTAIGDATGMAVTEMEQSTILEGAALPMEASDQTGWLMYSKEYDPSLLPGQKDAEGLDKTVTETKRTEWNADLSQRAASWQDRYRDYVASVIGLDKPGGEVSLGTRLEAQPTLGYGINPAYGQFLLGSGAGQFQADPMLEGYETQTKGDIFANYLSSRQPGYEPLRKQYSGLQNYLTAMNKGIDYGDPTTTPGTAQWARMFGAPGTAQQNQDLASNVMAATQAALGANPFASGALSSIYEQMEREKGTSQALSDFTNWASTAWT